MNTDIPTPETIEEVQKIIDADLAQKSQIVQPRNRAERRAMMKKLGKKNYEQFSTIGETAKKLNYIDLIQKLKKLNAEKENENGTIKNN